MFDLRQNNIYHWNDTLSPGDQLVHDTQFSLIILFYFPLFCNSFPRVSIWFILFHSYTIHNKVNLWSKLAYCAAEKFNFLSHIHRITAENVSFVWKNCFNSFNILRKRPTVEDDKTWLCRSTLFHKLKTLTTFPRFYMAKRLTGMSENFFQHERVFHNITIFIHKIGCIEREQQRASLLTRVLRMTGNLRVEFLSHFQGLASLIRSECQPATWDWGGNWKWLIREKVSACKHLIETDYVSLECECHTNDDWYASKLEVIN